MRQTLFRNFKPGEANKYPKNFDIITVESYHNISKKEIHLEIPMPNKRFKVFSALNTSGSHGKQITIIINDGTPNRYRVPGAAKKFMLEFDFGFDDLLNSEHNPLIIDDVAQKLDVVIIHDDMTIFMDTEDRKAHYDKLAKENTHFDKDNFNFEEEPKESGGGVIIGGP
ncbi:hypothetical protein RQM59_05910 [Flavobacteriaceae bacterium S356]|uniref:Uncharacterized protein n=1 Tax=Asprobacillus argus TaxID=3076534 RepID=A0ABU3LDX0_9FLAO|nr:hypothetical protein [Flavobacteriaceae bacterium S356]